MDVTIICIYKVLYIYMYGAISYMYTCDLTCLTSISEARDRRDIKISEVANKSVLRFINSCKLTYIHSNIVAYCTLVAWG
jgi:hypothetical protein